MNTLVGYLLYSIPIAFIVLSRKYMLRHDRLIGSGKITYILVAKQRQIVFLLLGILSALIILVVTQFPAFSRNVYQDM